MSISQAKKIHILLVEDDINLRYLLSENLKEKNFSVSIAENGNEGFDLLQKTQFDLCIIDVMLPGMDGFTLVAKMKTRYPSLPFIFLTARSQDEDKFKGFKLGADDYITKPFSFQELYYRVTAILRRMNIKTMSLATDTISVGSTMLHSNECILTINNLRRKLSRRETDILSRLMQNVGVFVSKSEILLQVWDKDDYYTSKSLDVYISRLRKLIKEDPNLEIENQYGNGYRIKLISSIADPLQDQS